MHQSQPQQGKHNNTRGSHSNGTSTTHSKTMSKHIGYTEAGVPIIQPEVYYQWIENHLSNQQLQKHTYAITGTTSGLGYWASFALRYAGATVVALNRSYVLLLSLSLCLKHSKLCNFVFTCIAITVLVHTPSYCMTPWLW